MLEVREVVVMTKLPVEFAVTETDGAGQAAPVGRPKQVSVYARFAVFLIAYVAEVPAGTLSDEGDALKADGFAFETFRMVLPPNKSAPVSGGPNGATMKKYFVPAVAEKLSWDCVY
jgi:hypothetical protein